MAKSDVPKREQWSGNWEVLFAYIGYTVGIGNVWRFPYLCYKHGGGAFLIPYLVTLFMAGLPVYYLEIALGQYSSSGPSTVWAFCPLFKGVGYCIVGLCVFACMYFFMLFAYMLRYLAASLTTQLPWATCDNPWNTPACISFLETDKNVTQTLANSSALQIAYNATVNGTTIKFRSAAQEYWENRLLHMTDGVYPTGGFQWELVVALLASTIIIFLCLVKGIQATGKVVYFTATFPYLVVLILLVRGATLPGAIDGILYYVTPNFSKLTDITVWGDAASQVFFSLGQAWGILIMFGSYNKFNHNSRRDAIIVCFMCPISSFLFGLVVFCIIGFLANQLDTAVTEVMKGGPDLIFVAYPQAVAMMPVAPLWSVLFFSMICVVTIDSTFSVFETILTAFMDEFPKFLRPKKALFTAIMSVIMFLLNLPLTTRAGIYIMNILDWYSVTFPPLAVAFMECVLVSHVYGWRRFSNDIKEMMGVSPSYYWIVSWGFIAPAIIVVMMCFHVFVHKSVTYGTYEYPFWAPVIGWFTCITSISFIPIFMVIQMYLKAGSLKKMLLNPLSTARELLKPEASWKRRAEDETSSEESEPMDTKDQENIDIETRKFFLKESGIDCDKF